MEESKWEEEGAPPRHRTWYMSLPLAMGDESYILGSLLVRFFARRTRKKEKC